MPKKFNNEQSVKLCQRYVDGTETMLDLADFYGCSESLISKTINFAIENGLVDEATVNRIRQKAADNSARYLNRICYTTSTPKSTNHEEIEKLRHQISTYDETYSDADEYPYSKEDLIAQLEKLMA